MDEPVNLPTDPSELSERDRQMLGRDPQEELAQATPTFVEREDEQYKQYFENYARSPLAQTNVDNIVALNRNGVFLYEVPTENRGEKQNHVIWVYNNPDHVLPIYEAIPAESWKDVADQPELIGRVNMALIESSNQAINFYKWDVVPRGFIVEGSKSFGLEAGNIAGIRVSYEEIKPLLNAVKSGDTEEVARQQKHLATSIVHELTHLERDDGLVSQVQTEIASHISQYIFDPHNNDVFNQQLADSLKRIEENRNAGKNQKPLDLYDKASYAALMIIADKLAGQSEAVQSALKSDTDPHKLNTLRRMSALIGDSEQRYLVETILPGMMKLDSSELMQMARDIEKSYNIQQDVMGME